MPPARSTSRTADATPDTDTNRSSGADTYVTFTGVLPATSCATADDVRVKNQRVPSAAGSDGREHSKWDVFHEIPELLRRIAALTLSVHPSPPSC
ncbi:MAG: hypothetical protein H6Q09_1778 [Acidobacteria bacterium]|nr:hypothetical protein [Acidobacteriota bacterium]